MELTKEFIEEQRQKLLKKQKYLRAQINRLKNEEPFLEESQEIGGRNMDSLEDDADEMNQQELTKLNESEALSSLAQVEKALSFIDLGKYGFDENTNEPIDIARLRFYPEATTKA